ncbi:MAG: DUF2809 domain-containing protein [Flavobacteriales bacterium]|nr:DUF2809 domain-containing protein [Flavobacteriales bacterium]
MIRFSLSHAVIAAIVLGVEVCIAAFVHDDFVRPYMGDLLVVILIHYGLRAFLRINANTAAWSTLLFAFAVEGTQALGLIHHLGLTDNLAAKLILGNTFQWGDLLAYALGVLIAWWSDRRWFHQASGTR